MGAITMSIIGLIVIIGFCGYCYLKQKAKMKKIEKIVSKLEVVDIEDGEDNVSNVQQTNNPSIIYTLSPRDKYGHLGLEEQNIANNRRIQNELLIRCEIDDEYD